VNALDHPRHEQLKWDRIRKSARERFGQPIGVDSGVHGKACCFRENGHRASDDHLVTEFCSLAGAGGAHVSEPTGHSQHIGPHSLDVGSIPAGHDGKRAFLGALGAAGHRCIDPARAVRSFQSCCEVARGVGMD
jgi:hypothetical protein